MELKFIWIKKYRIIEALGVNFNHSGEHIFQYEDESLHLLPNEKSILDFGPNVTGVTAIAGENGSGKSSLCEVVLETTATLKGGGLGYNILFDGIVCYGNHIFYHQDLVIKNLGELAESNYNLVPFKDSPFEQMREEWRDSFQKGAFVYYSNVLDIRSDIEAYNLANISTQSLLREEAQFSTFYA